MLTNNDLVEFQTPLYVYEESIFTRQYQRLNEALKDIPHLICFAVKANSNLSILKKFDQLGCGFDIVSGGELHRVCAAGADCSKVVFAGVGKTANEIRHGLIQGIRFFNVESIEELHHIEAIANEMSTVAPISLRINPNISIETHPYLATGVDKSKFGIPTSEIIPLYESMKASRSLKFVGVDAHIGSQINDVAPFETSLKQLISLADELRSQGAPITSIDLGGGLGVSFSGQYDPLDVEAYGRMVTSYMKQTPYQLIVEPWKYLISEAGSIISRVLYTKEYKKRAFLIIDAGMNDLMRPALYQAHHAVEVLGKEKSPKTHKYDIGGPVCESGCMLSTEEKLPEVQSGDFLIIKDAGAYGFSMASNYNTRTRPAEILIESNGSKRVIRRREEVKELFQSEKDYL